MRRARKGDSLGDRRSFRWRDREDKLVTGDHNYPAQLLEVTCWQGEGKKLGNKLECVLKQPFILETTQPIECVWITAQIPLIYHQCI